MFKKILLFLIFSICSIYGMSEDIKNINNNYHDTFYWDWSQIDCKDLSFPNTFLWGVGTSTFQIAGAQKSTWSEGSPYAQEMKKQWRAQGKDFCFAHDIGTDLQTLKEDIKKLKELNFNVYRFSIEWSNVEPEEGIFNEEVLEYYKGLCLELNKHGIQPFIVLHHYTDPIWFLNKGGFEYEKNIEYFVRYCAKVFEYLKPYSLLWCTYNAPEAYAIKGYGKAMTLPGKKNMHTMAIVLKNMLEAHVQVYSTLKPLASKDHKIGIIKNSYELEAWDFFNPLDWLGTHIGNFLVNTCVYNFFRTGTFKIYIPFLVNVDHYSPDACRSLDFIAINYYSHRFMSNFKLIDTPHEKQTDNEIYAVYPEGLYKAISQISEKLADPCNIPIIISENGLSSGNEQLRNEFLEKHLYVVSQAVKDGFNVIGYFYWSLYDNYEWGTYDKKYGIYSINNQTQVRTLKNGFEPLFEIMKKSN